QLAQAAGPEMANRVDEEEAVSCLQVPERGIQIAFLLRVDVWNAMTVANDLDVTAHARQVGRAQGRKRARFGRPAEPSENPGHHGTAAFWRKEGVGPDPPASDPSTRLQNRIGQSRQCRVGLAGATPR